MVQVAYPVDESVTHDSTLAGTVTFPEGNGIARLIVLFGMTPSTMSFHSLTFPALMKYQPPLASVIVTQPVAFVVYDFRGQGVRVVVVPLETTVPFAPTLDPLGTWCTHSLMIGPPGVNVMSFGDDIGPAVTVMFAIGDVEVPCTTRTRNVVPDSAGDDVVVKDEVVGSVTTLPVLWLSYARTTVRDAAMTTTDTANARTLRDRPLGSVKVSRTLRLVWVRL